MGLYVVKVDARGEDKFVARVTRELQFDSTTAIFWPRRQLRQRRGGKWHVTLTPVFPGYVFVRATAISAELFQRLRRIDGFHRFLPKNDNMVPLESDEERVIEHLRSHGEIIGSSQVRFDASNRIVVLKGPLQGMEGRIVKVDRRKGRARVKLDLYNQGFEIDFGFEAIEPE
jgi:transcriptional antiterminator NusG